MSSVDIIIDEIDDLSRKLIRITECCERNLLADLRLTPAQATTLQVLGDLGEVTMNGLADEMRLHGTTMTRMVDALVERGFAERLSDPRDRRVVRVRLTEAGGDARAQVRERKRESMRAIVKARSEADRQSVVQGLRLAVGLAEGWGDRCCGNGKPRPEAG